MNKKNVRGINRNRIQWMLKNFTRIDELIDIGCLSFSTRNFGLNVGWVESSKIIRIKETLERFNLNFLEVKQKKCHVLKFQNVFSFLLFLILW